MDGVFSIASKNSCTLDLFFGVDYHSHLGTKRGGMAVYGSQGFIKSIRSIENTPFRTKFDGGLGELERILRIGRIFNTGPQPLLIQSHLDNFAIAAVREINDGAKLVASAYGNGHIRSMETSHGHISTTKLAATPIDQKSTLMKGLLHTQEKIEGSMPILLLTPEGIYASRDKFGRTPIVVGRREDVHCVSFESSAYINLGYTGYRELGPGEIIYTTPESAETVSPPREEMKIYSFLWVRCGYPAPGYENISVGSIRYECGKLSAKRNDAQPEVVADVPDSGIAHVIGYANESGIPFARPFIKYTPTQPRPFMPQNQGQRDLIARMKPIPVDVLVRGKKLPFTDDSIMRGIRLSRAAEFLYHSGVREVHIRPTCLPLMFGYPYLNLSRSTSELGLITRHIIRDRESDDMSQNVSSTYMNPDSTNYKEMIEGIHKHLRFTTPRYHRLGNLVKSTGISSHKLYTYYQNGRKQKNFTRKSDITGYYR